MALPTFDTLWKNYPDADEMRKTCFNKQSTAKDPFDNYCAVLMSDCLLRSGVRLENCLGRRCWSHPGSRHLLLASELAAWLAKTPPDGFGKKQDVDPKRFQELLAGRTGVVYFADYWTRKNESFEGRSGDHIDLWRYNEITSGSMFYRSVIEFFGLVSDLNKSKAVWFWEVK